MRFADSSTAPTRRTARCWRKRELKSASVKQRAARSSLNSPPYQASSPSGTTSSARFKTDSQLVSARLVEEIETVALLHRVVHALVEALEALGRGLGDAGAALLSADGGQVTLNTAFEQLLGELRARPTLDEEPEPVRQAVEVRDHACRGVLRRPRRRSEPGLLAAVAERDAREVARREETPVTRARGAADS